MHYYTYAYLREDKTPYYIGKGKGKRIYSTNRIIKPPKDKSRVIYLKQNLTEEEAFRHEIYMIAVFGRKDLGTGILYNLTDGGDGASGLSHSEESKIKMSGAKKGKSQSEETRRKMSEAKIGENHPNYGKTHSEETIKKMSEAHKNITEETRKKLSEASKGNTNMLGKTHSEESRKKMSEAHKNITEETRIKLSEAKKGRKWWNDGCGNRKRMLEYPGNGWRLGRK